MTTLRRILQATAQGSPLSDGAQALPTGAPGVVLENRLGSSSDGGVSNGKKREREALGDDKAAGGGAAEGGSSFLSSSRDRKRGKGSPRTISRKRELKSRVDGDNGDSNSTEKPNGRSPRVSDDKPGWESSIRTKRERTSPTVAVQVQDQARPPTPPPPPSPESNDESSSKKKKKTGENADDGKGSSTAFSASAAASVPVATNDAVYALVKRETYEEKDKDGTMQPSPTTLLHPKRSRDSSSKDSRDSKDGTKNGDSLRPPPRNASKKYSSTAAEGDASAAVESEATPVVSTSSKKFAPSKKSSTLEEDVTVVQWVMCDKCQKWRDVPGAEYKKIPPSSPWYCSLNTWEPKYASCSASQKESPEDEGEGAERQQAAAKRRRKDEENARRKKKRMFADDGTIAVERSAPSSSVKEVEAKRYSDGKIGSSARRSGKKPILHTAGGDKSGTESSSRKRGEGGKNGKPSRGPPGAKNLRPSISNMMANRSNNGKGPAKKEWNWVMCETCQQWRKLPPEVDVERLPEKWYCHMNQWDKQRASCSAPQEADDGQAQEEAAAAGEAAKNVIVRLPDGVNLYGGQFFPVKGGRRPPSNYRELIVTHYRHFSKYELSANTFYNARYQDSSRFTPRGSFRRGNKKSASEKGAVWAPETSVSASLREQKGIAASALVKHSTLRKLLGSSLSKPSSLKAKEESGDNDEDQVFKTEENGVSAFEFIKPEDDMAGLPAAMLKLSKPWKRAGGWIGNKSFFCNKYSKPE